MDRSDKVDNIVGDRVMTNKLRINVDDSSSSDDSDREEHEAQDVAAAREALLPLPPTARRRLLSKQLSMKETTREAKWEKRRRQILRRSGLVSVVSREQQEGDDDGGGRNNKSAVDGRHHVVRSSSERAMRCLTDEDLDELRGSFELGFGFDEETGGAHLRNTLPALDFYFAVNRQLSDPKLRTASPTSTLSTVSSSSTLPDTPSPRSPNDDPAASGADPWKIFFPGDNPQLVKTRLRHWAQVVACAIKHSC
ncbi:hypothetical protein C2845_PM11G03450 [Panicum miliaceum]|uniref:Uncharacterized protein n=1 Tax=Panicum miliaceum TaxID=4540 RepID=A0A3L6RTX7_PANMI|nr:hypothetical protein C2845_PM11G03450 [Panicum miliaceum]